MNTKNVILTCLVIILCVVIAVTTVTTLFVSAKDTQLSVDLTEINQGDNLTISLTDENGNPLANKTVQITINNVTYNRTMNDSGRSQLHIDLEPGDYSVEVKFDGETFKYKQSELIQSLKVQKEPQPIETTSSETSSSSTSTYTDTQNSDIIEEDYSDGTYFVRKTDGWVYYYDTITGESGRFP